MYCWCRSPSLSIASLKSTTTLLMQQGMPKRKESLRWFVDFIFGMKQPFGKIYVRYAEPVSLGRSRWRTLAAGEDEAGDPSAEPGTGLAFDVCTRIEQATPIKSADVLTMVLLAANGIGP